MSNPNVDWDHAPEWAQCWAMDADGMACWYDAEPDLDEPDLVWTTIKESVWSGFAEEMKSAVAPTFEWSSKDWKKSLSHRWVAERLTDRPLKERA